MTRAAVLHATNGPLWIEDVDVDDPKDHEVKIRLHAAGICHSDASHISGLFPIPLPAVLGHEGAGVVEAVGSAVTRVSPGDHVILSSIPQCGRCFFCGRGQPTACEVRMKVPAPGGQLDGTTRFHQGDDDVAQMCFAGTFIETTVAPEISVVKIPAESDMVAAALVGCAVVTGVGAARNVASIQPGDTAVVIGCGGIGLNVVQGARLAGAEQIVAIDVVDLKLELAQRLGATHVVNASAEDPLEAVRGLTEGRGADVAFDATGHPTAVAQAFDLTRRGGQTIFIGVAPADATIPVRPVQTGARIVKGCLYGNGSIDHEFPTLLKEYEQGLLDLKTLVSQTLPLGDINAGFEDMLSGKVARSVIVYD